MTLRSRAAALISVRLVVGTLLLGSATFIELSVPGAFRVDPYFFLIGLTYALSVVYLATLRFVERQPWLVDVQLWVDAVLVSAFIFVTGGITSDFSSLYLLPIIAASLIRFRRGALQVAGLSAVLYLAIVAGQYFAIGGAGWHAPVQHALPSARFGRFVVGINLFGFVAVAALAGSLAEGLRSAGTRLADASVAIADLRAFNEHVINSLVSGLITADSLGRVLTCNRAAAAIIGVPVPDAIGEPAADLLGFPAAFRDRLTALGQTRSQRADFEYHTRDHREIEIGVTAARVVFPDGQFGSLFTFQDVTDVKRLERDAGLRQRLAAVGEMAAGIAHEIRNPLAAMSGSMQLLRDELTLTGEQAQLMDIVLRESERLNQTIRSFLEYARPQQPTVTRFDLGAVVQDAATLLRNRPDVREGHLLEVEVPPEPVWYEGDEHQIRQVLWNLASNGLRAMPSGGRLVVSARPRPGDGTSDGTAHRVAGTSADDGTRGRAGDDVELLVRDAGHGIPAEQLDGIFEPFRSSFARGTGLGLAIVHRIVTGCGGTIDVASAVGVGTTVRVRLPRRAVPSADGHAPEPVVLRTVALRPASLRAASLRAAV
jgi:two-component system, NtrC family, sensor histidine kinase PilS